MSAVDPLAVGMADLAALVDQEIAALAASAKVLSQTLQVGNVVQATVLPSNGLSDLLQIAGQRVAASLPPTLRPGDTLQVQVTGFDGDRIMVQIVGDIEADQAAQAGPPAAPLSLSAGAIVAANITPAAGSAVPSALPIEDAAVAAATPQTASAAPTVPQSTQLPVPPPAVEVVSAGGAGGSGIPAAVPRLSAPSPLAPPAPPPDMSVVVSARPTGAAAYAAVPRAAAPAAPTAGAAGAVPRATIAESGPNLIETRLAATSMPRTVIVPTARTAAPPPDVPHVASPVTRPFVAAPQIAPRGAPQAPPVIPARTVAAAAALPSIAARPAGLAAFTQPAALLRALQLPVTASNVASATLAMERPQRLPAVLQTLEAALPDGAADPRVATLRTLLSFVGRIEPDSPVLATQLAAYVEHVATGAEPKLATLLAAVEVAEPTPSPTPAASAAAPPAQSNTPPPAAAAHAAPTPAIATAIAGERALALGGDLKQTLMSIAADPTTSASLAPALASALTAITAVQTDAANLLNANPNGFGFTVPMTTPSGTQLARIRVDRDGGKSGAAVDPSNFRVAFVLDTANLGTIAIDLVTVGREVTVEVRAERGTAVRAFRDALGTLTSRLEALRYRVASADAKIGQMGTLTMAAAAPAAPHDPNAVVDRSA